MNAKLSFIVAVAIVAQFTPIHSAPSTQEESKSLKTSPAYNFSQLYTFGGLNGADTLDTASRLESTNGKWEAIDAMLKTSYEFCGAVFGKQIYLFGGLKNISVNTELALACVYNCLSDTYTILRSLPEKRARCGAAALADSIYVVGGAVGSSDSYSSSLIRYDIQNNLWSTLEPMNAARVGHQLIELGGLLYAIGGFPDSVGKAVEIYNPAINQWSSVASTQNKHLFFGAAKHEGKIYVLSENGFEKYSPSINQWTNLNPPSDHAYSGSTLVTMNNQLWAIGGRDTEDGKSTKRVYTYDPSTNLWTKQHNMDVLRAYHAAFVVNH